MAAAVANAIIAKNAKLAGKWKAESVGVFAIVGAPATENACKAVASKGLDLSAHRARLADEAVLRGADLILAMSQTQVKAAAIVAPNVTVKLLGSGIADPFGGDEGEYVACLRAIEQAVQQELKRLLM